jgi:O-glycosyl hydrolase
MLKAFGAMSTRRASRHARIGLGLMLAVFHLFSGRITAAGSITINGALTNQVIDGFGVNANYWSWDSNSLPAALDALVDQAGMSVFRVIMNNGWEVTNDNNDSSVMNWNYYNALYSNPEFEKLWGLIGYLNQKGITTNLMLNFQGPGPDWMGGSSLNYGDEDEWAEMIVSLLVYGRNTRHLQFGLLAPFNEPNISGEGINMPDVSQYMTALHDLAVKLDAYGLGDIRLVGPDLAYGGTDYMPEIMSDAVVMAKMGHFGIHSYSDNGSGSGGVSDFLQQSDYPDRNFWVTEFNVWCNSCEYDAQGTNDWDYALGTAQYLLYHLANNASCGLVWEGYDSYYPHHGNWSCWGLLGVDNQNASPLTYSPRPGFYALTQFAKFVRPGAQRLTVSGASDPISLLAFYHSKLGQLSLVGINPDTSGGVVSGALTSLPAIQSLDLYYSNRDTNLCLAGTVPVSNGQFTVSVPADCVFTLTGSDPSKIAVSVQLTNPPDGAQFSLPTPILLQANAITSTGSITSVAFYNETTRLGKVDSPPYNLVWTNAFPGNYNLTAWASNSLGNVGASKTVRLTAIGPLTSLRLIPTNTSVIPYGTFQFSAAGVDELGTPLLSQPVLTWGVSGGGRIDSNGLFTAGPSPGGPFLVWASNSEVIGYASVVITNQVNVALAGQGQAWYGMPSATGNAPVMLAPLLNDGDLLSDFPLTPGGAWDSANAYEAAGVTWTSPQTFNLVRYYNGSYSPNNNGVFAAGFTLQFSLDGTQWTNAGPEWALSPAYVYNSAVSAGTTFTFAGGVATVYGVRCAGRVHTTDDYTNSWVAFARELEAIIQVPPQSPPVLRVSAATDSIAIFWPGSLTNYILQTTANLRPSANWVAVTNMPQIIGAEQRVTINPVGAQQFFRLRIRP